MNFDSIAKSVADQVARPRAFIAAAACVLVWAIFGPITGYSDLWQLAINTSTTIITFLMLFLLQATQARDTAALQVKLDEIIAAIPDARDEIRRAEDHTLQELEDLRR